MSVFPGPSISDGDQVAWAGEGHQLPEAGAVRDGDRPVDSGRLARCGRVASLAGRGAPDSIDRPDILNFQNVDYGAVEIVK